MSTIAQIKTALVSVLTAAITDIDQSSLVDFLPAITTRKVALLVPPMGMRGNIGWKTPNRTPLLQSHRIPCEFWTRIDNADLTTGIGYANEICLKGARAVIASGNLGGVVMGVGHYLINGEDNGPDIEYRVDDEMVAIGNGRTTFLRATLFVPVVDYADAS